MCSRRAQEKLLALSIVACSLKRVRLCKKEAGTRELESKIMGVSEEEAAVSHVDPTMTDPSRLRRSRSICLSKCVRRNHLRRTSLCTESANAVQPHDSSQVLKVVEEDKILNVNETLPEIEDPNYEQPLKVFRRAGTPDKTLHTAYEVPQLKTHVSSCQALRQAVSRLYNIDDFEMAKIGEGFFSEVFRVEHKSEGKVMVLKRNKNRANRSAMLKEVQLMNNLHHKNVLKYEGACVSEGQLHALTEFVNGGSLDQMVLSGSVDNGEFPWLDRVSLALDIDEGLSYLHSRRIFHRDLTSKNVLIRKSERRLSAVVADFGLAAQIPSSPDDVLPPVGSPYWMSPECLRGHYYDHRSDIFSFGIVLCEMIARVEADPDYLPRTENFGVDYLAFSQLVSPECPPEFLKLAFSCVNFLPDNRPDCAELKSSFQRIIAVLKPKKREKDLKDMTEKLNGLTFRQRTPDTIGQEMSKLDPHYIPSPEDGMNPFLHLFGNGKIIGQFFSCFEFNAASLPAKRPNYRKTVSVIGQHPTQLDT